MIRRRRKYTKLFGKFPKLYTIIGAGLLFVLLIIILFSAKRCEKLSAFDSIEVKLIEKRGVLRVGIRDDLLGFSNGSEGLEIELAKRLGDYILPDKAGNSVEFVIISSRMLGTKLSDGSIDVAIMQLPMGWNTGKYAYSSSYYMDSCVLTISSTDSKQSLENAEIGVIVDTICESRLDSFISEKAPKVKKVRYATYDIMFNALNSGKIDACVLTGAYYNMYRAKYSLYKHEVELKPIEYAFASSVENAALMEIASAVIADLKASGELDSLVKEYLG